MNHCHYRAGQFECDHRSRADRADTVGKIASVTRVGMALAVEPGRVIAGNAGILVSRVLYTKQPGESRFRIRDAAMIADNTRPRAREVLVSGKDARLVRRRETYDDLVLYERLAL